MERIEHCGGTGYTEVRRTQLPGRGEVSGEDTYQYVIGQSGEIIGEHCTLRRTWLNGTEITDPAPARALRREASWQCAIPALPRVP